MITYLAILLDAARPERARQRDERGATAVEYGLLVALIAAAIIAIVGFLGTDVKNAFDSVENSIGTDAG
ncbi:Flp family type IVb pilin [Nocardioides sp.]|uniref:Flp family type IVb pilin n=1 Tax=Nocardioides sp. TaxID=35761 RepID=UPI003514002E